MAEFDPDFFREKADPAAQIDASQDPNGLDAALADALRAATAAGRWDVVAQLATALQSRGAPVGPVVDLASERAKRGSR